jgi:hypothetical protein
MTAHCFSWRAGLAGRWAAELRAEKKKESRGCDLQLLYAATSTALDSLLQHKPDYRNSNR